MLLKPSRVVLVVALAALGGCGGGSSPTTPPVTTPTAAPTPTPTPSVTPTPSATSCRYGMGTVNTSCARNNPTFLGDVDAAINLLGQQHPELFNFNDTNGGDAWRVLDADRFYAGVIANLQAKDYCAGFDLQNLQVKNSNEFSEDYDILLSSNFIRRGASSYRETCSPANFPLDAKDLIDSVRVAFFGFKCPDDVAVPNNGSNRLPVGCTGNVTATPKNKENQDVDPRIHGSQITWTWELESGHPADLINYPDKPFNKSVVGLSVGNFTLCAIVKEVQGCLHGEVVPPSPR
ncbi:MAG TPA: hypothetical protein VK132_10095 [Gemmatimonadales bacterium]|nr:hypothetical protein [Gemmatimonadales bacterium]